MVTYAVRLHQIQQHFPMISFLAEDEQAYISGVEANRTMVRGQIEGLEKQIEAATELHRRVGLVSESSCRTAGACFTTL